MMTLFTMGESSPVVTCGAVVGRILEVSDHPNADRLWICQVDIGPYGGLMERKLTVVHGGTRPLRPGDLRSSTT